MSFRRHLAQAADRFIDRLAVRLLDRVQERVLHPHTLLLAEAQRQSAEYARTHMAAALVLRQREEVLRIAFSRAPVEGLILEFGFAGGDSIRVLADREKAGRLVHGFDSFQGLPEDWPGRHEERGHYSTGGVLPAIPGNARLHTGLFDQTLPLFLAAHPGPVAFVHIDCDLYSSTRTVLEGLAPRLVAGTVILFDEYFNFVGWQDHEFRAFQEFVAQRGLRYRYLCWGYQQVAVILS